MTLLKISDFADNLVSPDDGAPLQTAFDPVGVMTACASPSRSFRVFRGCPRTPAGAECCHGRSGSRVTGAASASGAASALAVLERRQQGRRRQRRAFLEAPANAVCRPPAACAGRWSRHDRRRI